MRRVGQPKQSTIERARQQTIEKERASRKRWRGERSDLRKSFRNLRKSDSAQDSSDILDEIKDRKTLTSTSGSRDPYAGSDASYGRDENRFADKYDRVRDRLEEKSINEVGRQSDRAAARNARLSGKNKKVNDTSETADPETGDRLDDFDPTRSFNPGKYSNILYNLARGNEKVDKTSPAIFKSEKYKATDVSSMDIKAASEIANAQRLQGKGKTAAQSQAYNARVARNKMANIEKANFNQSQENSRVSTLNTQLANSDAKVNYTASEQAKLDYKQDIGKKNKFISEAMGESAERAMLDEQASGMFNKEQRQWEIDKARYRNLKSSEFELDKEDLFKVNFIDEENEGDGKKPNEKRKGARFSKGKYKMYPDGTIEVD